MLPFTADVLFSSFETYNRALWPLPVLALAAALAIILLALRPVRGGDRATSALVTLAWFWVGIGYFFAHFAAIDFAAPIYGAFFVLEGLLFAWTAVARGRASFRFSTNPFDWAGLALTTAAVAWPLVDWLFGHGWQSARVAGLAPSPTAVFTLGLLLLTARRAPLRLAVIPLLWTLAAGARGWALSIPQDLALPAAGLCAFALIFWQSRRQKRA